MKKLTLSLAGAAAAIALGGTASAGELRLGMAMHDFEVNMDDRRESGVNFQPQYVWNSPDFLRILASPRPYVIASINSDQETNFVGGGVLWKKNFWDTAYFWEIDTGIVYQDGRTDLPPPDQPVERQRVLDTEITFGSETQFHFVSGLGMAVTEEWDVQLFFEHLSHGQIFGDSDKNEGVENIGIKFGYKFD
ncbi:acyloxyacyl hydrolase [Aquisalinus flavus]|uniref:Lipid A 3-O-deacylase n=1 Tax=Aquisalinus flavus TaxID=1526572 RepID=A0A8J2Y335_9PROT|nr:acyloxyacyl hydrolase [Aquisalinus flavus]MBD0427117.1 acyloxyacyl hydrolase [Aquisalinus flavus]UNE46938.1 acyloxyacyl hydrolase [Aquisalinus flavus]GGC98520.1 hypothetical protein GCM10011342_04310 [Aquisalinus flavus]